MSSPVIDEPVCKPIDKRGGWLVDTEDGLRRPESWSIDMPNQFEAGKRIAKRRNLTRGDIEVLGVRSQALAKRAWDRCHFDRQVVPVTAPVVDKEGNKTGETQVISRDQGLRDTTAESPGSTRFLGWYPHRPGEVGDRRQRFIGERLGPVDQQPGPVALEEVQRLRADP